MRNFLVAWPFYRNLVGEEHRGLKLGWVADAFGNSPNLPQLFKQLRADCVGFTTYRVCSGDLWTGIDGTSIFCYDWFPAVRVGAFEKHPPCEACQGKGCPTCGGKGLRIIGGYDSRMIRDALEKAIASPGDWTVLWLTTEELLPDARLTEVVEELNRKYAGRATIRFANPSDIHEKYLPTMRGIRDTKGVPPVEDLNPAMPGCYVSRIRCKQRTRAIGYKLIAAEAALANQAWRQGSPIAPPADLAEAWRLVAFNQFHDAITGTHIDSAYVELMDMLDRAEIIAERYVPETEEGMARPSAESLKGRPIGRILMKMGKVTRAQVHEALQLQKQQQRLLGQTLCGLGYLDEEDLHLALAAQLGVPADQPFTAVGPDPVERRIGPFQVRFDRKGILSILRDGQDVFGVLHPSSRSGRDFRIGELVLEPDFGDAWGRRLAPMGGEQGTVSLVPLGNYHQRVEATDGAIRWHGVYTGNDIKVRKLRWTVTMGLSPDGWRLDFVTEIDWDTHSRRIRVLVPVASREDTATYEVPFGFIDRKWEPDKIDYSQWRANSMEWPALHWVRKKIDDKRGVALLNKGLPCNRWMPGRLDLSLLRSPEWTFCVVEPEHYEFYDTDGQRDAGRHRFEYSIWPYCDGLAESELTRAGYAYNLPAPIDLPFQVTGDVVVTAFKPAEDGSGWILRLQETTGQGTTVAIDFDRPRQVTPVNLLEQPQAEPTPLRRFEVPLHRHGILTLRVR